jgi:hypothetical protein
MKLAEMADLLDGLASFLDRFGTKTALNDLRAVSDCFRAFPEDSVSGFCNFVTKAKEGGAGGRRASPVVDTSKVSQAVGRIRHFLDHRHDYDYSQIDQLLEPVSKLKLLEIKAVGEQIDCPMTGKTKAAMIASLRGWLSDIRLSAHQSSFSLNAASS